MNVRVEQQTHVSLSFSQINKLIFLKKTSLTYFSQDKKEQKTRAKMDKAVNGFDFSKVYIINGLIKSKTISRCQMHETFPA